MSEHRRQTQRVRIHSHSNSHSTRHTMRVVHQKGGGASMYHIADTERVEKWKAALSANPSLEMFADVISEPNWGTMKTDTEKLELYVKLIEQQDEMFWTALTIIYNELEIDPEADDLDTIVIGKLDMISARQVALKEYLSDVYKLITCGIAAAPKVSLQKNYQKHTRFIDEPLSNLLIWPARVTNIFVASIAKILVGLKQNPDLLESTKGKPDLQIMFADLYNTVIQNEVLNYTSKELRDGYYLWQAMSEGNIPLDECAFTDTRICSKPVPSTRSLWRNFCTSYQASTGLTVFTSKTNMATQWFSHIVADIYKLYKTMDAAAIRSRLLELMPETGVSVKKTSSSSYRPPIAEAITTKLGVMMRLLDPEQYTFIFHLLYLMSQIEREDTK